MFESLSDRLSGILDKLTRRGALREADVEEALREIRRALLEADVALDVARAFTEQVKQKAVGAELIKSVTPGQLVVKIVHDQLVETLGSEGQSIDLNAAPPIPIRSSTPPSRIWRWSRKARNSSARAAWSRLPSIL